MNQPTPEEIGSEINIIDNFLIWLRTKAYDPVACLDYGICVIAKSPNRECKDDCILFTGDHMDLIKEYYNVQDSEKVAEIKHLMGMDETENEKQITS